MSSDVRSRVLAYAQSAPSPTRHQVRLQRLLVGGSAMAWSTAILWWFEGVRVSPRPAWLALAMGLIAAVCAGLALWIAAERGSSMLGRSRRVLTAAVVAIPLVLVICKLALTACAEGMSDVWIGRPGTRCFAVALLAGAGPFAAILWTRRRTVTSAVHWSGAAVGTAAGAIGWTVNELRCQVGYAPHVLLGHVLPMLIFVGLGVALSALLVPRSVRLS